MPSGIPEIEKTPDSINDMGKVKAVVDEIEPAEVIQPVKMTDINGTEYEGSFILRVPTSQDYMNIEKMKVRLAGGVPLAMFDPDAADFITAMATCYIMFAALPKGGEKNNPAPAWWNTMKTSEIPGELISQLNDAVRDHAARYFRYDPETGRNTSGRCVVEFGERIGTAKAG